MLSSRMPRTALTIRASSAAWWRMSSASSTMGSVPSVLLLLQPVGELVGRAGDLVAQLQIVTETMCIQRAGLDGGAHGTAGFLRMAAVAEAALFGQCLDVAEVFRDVFLARRL